MFRETNLYNTIRKLEWEYIKPLHTASMLIGTIRAMRREHQYFTEALRRIAALLHEYELPQNATRAYRELVHGFRELEIFKRRHMENEVALYSRALAREEQLMDK
jgi:iron-sulfur cluster repair protein YtfE (RIC family)